MAEKTSLERSHSKSSNAKLTMICFLLSFAVIILWIGIALLKTEKTFGITISIIGLVFTLLNLFLVSKFTR
jgi:hypothetical protein